MSNLQRKNRNYLSILSLLVSAIIIFYLTFVYYPKYNNTRTEATISWDVSGYYMYLPAKFIYKDMRQCKFKDDVIQKYYPAPDFQQAFKVPNGNYVMKYPIGQALQFMPSFFIADWYAKAHPESYEADGFSKPYQFMITLEGFLVSLLGLWFLRLILLHFFRDKVVALTILGIAIGSNYLEYASLSGAMTHNNLFTIYTLLIYTSIKYYQNPKIIKAVLMGLLIGLATITRPTELMSILIPIFWGLSLTKKSILERLTFFKSHIIHLGFTALSMLLVGSIQLIYWKKMSGDWFVYSYEEQGFSWLKPHFMDGLFSYKSGWLVYSPIMIFAVLGFYFLYRNHRKVFIGVSVFAFIFTYVTFAWDIWWYGGSLGIRAMVQSYPILAFPFAAFVEFMIKKDWRILITSIAAIIFIYFNFWFTHQAHKGGMLHAGMMTRAYFWKILGTYEKVDTDVKLLDNDEYFDGIPKNLKTLKTFDFESDTFNLRTDLKPLNGNHSLILDKDHQWSPSYEIKNDNITGKWIKATAKYNAPIKEWDIWKMTMIYVGFYKADGTKVKERSIRVHRVLHNSKTIEVDIDIQIPAARYDKILVKFGNMGGQKPIIIDDLKVECFE